MASTEAAPTTNAPDGVLLVGVGGFTLIAECDVGQTFQGTGNFLAYLWDPLSDWAYSNDILVPVPASASGQRRIAFPGWTVSNPRGRVAHIASGVGITGGNITLKYCCTMLKGFRS
jgi:hypothetical protein